MLNLIKAQGNYMNYERILKVLKVSYLIIGIIILNPAFAQKSHDEILQQFLKQRKQMMEQIMKSFDDDSFFKDFDDTFGDKFEDDFFKQFKQRGFGGIQGFEHSGDSVSVEEKVADDGTISIIIRPKSKDIKLDIQSTDDQIIINSETVVKEETQSEEGQSQSFYKSSSSRSVTIPEGYHALPAEPLDGGLKIRLVQKDKNYFKKQAQDSKVPESEKTPVGKRQGEETI